MTAPSAAGGGFDKLFDSDIFILISVTLKYGRRPIKKTSASGGSGIYFATKMV
jgi:hypothetical protein